MQVNLGNNETWDTHGNAFPHLKDKLLPPTDRAVSALLDDLDASGLLDSTLVVMAGEFGRTPRISHLPEALQAARPRPLGPGAVGLPRGRRHRSGAGSSAPSDRIGGHPASDPQTPENLAATIYHALGIPPTRRLARRTRIARTTSTAAARSPAWHDGLVPLVPTPVPLVPTSDLCSPYSALSADRPHPTP